MISDSSVIFSALFSLIFVSLSSLSLLEQTILVDFYSTDDKNNIITYKCTYNNMFEHPDEGEEQPRMETLYVKCSRNLSTCFRNVLQFVKWANSRPSRVSNLKFVSNSGASKISYQKWGNSAIISEVHNLWNNNYPPIIQIKTVEAGFYE